MKKVAHVTWEEYEELRARDESDCYLRGDSYISFHENVLTYHEILEVHEGYGSSNYIWENLPVIVENTH